MTNRKKDRFTGISPETLSFLKTLSVNNNKAWFEAHRQDYEDHILRPIKNLVSDMGEFMLAVDPYFEITPAVNKTISRIYRDTRFSKDKSPFRSNMWIVFKRPRKDWMDAPGYFFEIFPDWYRYGMGFYRASSAMMSRFRESIDEDPGEFLDVISFYSEEKIFILEGEKYKKILEEDKPKEIQDWYQRKNFYLVHNSEIDDRLFCRDLIVDLIYGFSLIAPLYQYLWKIKSDA